MNDPKHRWYDLDAQKNDLSFFAKWQQDLTPALQLFADAQYRRVNYDINGFRNNPTLVIKNTYNFFNPKLGLSYRLKDLLAYASFSVANKEPNRDDFEAGLQQQPKPERLNDLEVGIEKRSTKKSWSANIYYMNYKDQLVLTGMINDVGAYTRTNIPESYRLGVELQGNIEACNWLRIDFRIVDGRAEDAAGEGDLAFGKPALAADRAGERRVHYRSSPAAATAFNPSSAETKRS